MIANKWYCIAQTSTFDTRCSINVAFDGHDIQFSASVKYGASSINITRCIIPDGISFSIRLRESGSQWFVDITSSAKITPVVTVSDSEYWTSVNKPAAEGNIILLLTDITSKYNTSSFGGDSLFELVNVGTSDVPRYAVVPKVFQGQNPGVISRTFMTFGGLGADSNGEDDPSGVSYLRNLLDVRLSEFLEDSDVLTYDKNQGLWVNKKGGFNEEKLEEYLEKYKYITEDDIKGLLVLLQWFEFDDANHAVRVKSDFNFVVPNALSFGGLGTYSGGGEGGVSYLKNLLDVQLGTLLEDGEVLVYDKHLDRWVNKSIETGLDVDSLQKYLTDNKYITSADVDGLQGQINNNATNIALLLSWLEYDEVNKALRVKNGYNFIVDGALSFGGLGEDDNPTPGGLTQVTIQLGNNPNDSYVSENGKVILPAYPVIPTLLSAFENDKGYLVVSDLDGYAKLTDVPSVEGFALTEDLNALSKQIEGYDNKFADVGESILDIEEDISKLAPLADLEKLEEAVNPLFGYFDATGSANNALKLGGQLPSYYATVDALNLVKNDVTAVSNRVQKFEDVIGIDSNGDVYIKGMRNFYTEGGTIGMAGLGSGGSGGGTAGLGSVTVRVNGQDYITDASGIVTIPNYPSLAGYATQSWVGANYQPKGNYLTSVSWSDVSSKPTTLAGYGITDAVYGFSGDGYAFLSVANGHIVHYGDDGNWRLTNKPWTLEYVILHHLNFTDYALSKNGGTITGDTDALKIRRNGNGYSAISYYNTDGADYNLVGVLGYDNHGNAATYSVGANTWYTLYHTGNFNPANYLPLSGGTIVSDSFMPLILDSNNNQSRLQFRVGGADKALVGWNSSEGAWLYSYPSGSYIHIKDDGTPCYNYNPLIHSGNIGSQSVAKSTETRRFETILVASSDNRDLNTALFGGGLMRNYSGYTDAYFSNHPEGMLYGCVIEFSAYGTSQSKNDLAAQLAWDVNHRGSDSTRNLWWRANDDRNFANAKWHKIAFTDSNVASATKLQTARTIWGQSFDGSGDVSGALNLGASKLYWASEPEHYYIGFDADNYTAICNYYGLKFLVSQSEKMRIAYSGNVLIGSTTDSGEKLQVNGIGKFEVSTNNLLLIEPATNSLDGSGIAFWSSGGWKNGTINASTLYLNNTTEGNVIVGNTLKGGHIEAFDFSSSKDDYFIDNGKNIPWYGLSVRDGYSKGVWLSGYTSVRLKTSSKYAVLDQNYFETNGKVRFMDKHVIIGAYMAPYADIRTELSLINGDDAESMFILGSAGQRTWGIESRASSENYRFSLYSWLGGKHCVSVAINGNVSIGTQDDWGHPLAVNGSIYAESGLYTKGFYAGYNLDGGGRAQAVLVTPVDAPCDLWLGTNTMQHWSINVRGSGEDYYLGFYNTNFGQVLTLHRDGGAQFNRHLNVSSNLTVTGDIISEGTVAMARLTSSSDAKLKENIKWLSADRAMGVVRALRPTEWNWKKDHTHSFGFIAQDVQPIIPEMVSSVNDTLRLEYNQLHAFEIGAIQHIDSEVEILKRRVNELENELKQYRRNA